MPDFEFDNIVTTDVEWPKRGRKAKPVPEALANALRESLTSEKIPNLVLPMDQVTSFANVLSAAGRKLNMRIERHVEENVPEKGMATYHFRARSKRNREA